MSVRRIGEQLRNNAVALISLVVALTSLAYSSWRNESTEYNRNQRDASFQLLLKLGDLHQITDHIYYDRDLEDKGNPRTGWAIVDTVRGIAVVVDEPVPARAVALHAAWAENSGCIVRRSDCDHAAALQRIEQAMEALRDDLVTHLQSLD